ncbi:MAG: hypothetical protein E7615_01920 [Ruminococcaceae bacterium]|nr:hypothetical protein [Oscillospiraceae bacterium]
MKNFKLFSVLALVFVLSFALVACSGGESETKETTETEETQPIEETTDETVAETEAETTAEPMKTSPFENRQKPANATFEQCFPAPTVDKRQATYDYMMKMATVEWTPSVDFVTTHRPDVERDYSVNLEYKAGKTYYGICYGETKANYDEFMDHIKDGKLYCDSYYYQDIVGNHCSSCMFLAYQQIIPVGYGTLRPSTARKGIFKLAGDLENPGDGTWYSKDVFTLNGQAAVYEAYTTLDKGDILFKCIPGSGHTRFVTKVEVSKTVAGKLNPSRSYVYVIENTNAWLDSNKNTTWWVDKKYTFDKLWSTEFMPITLDTYFDDNDKVWDAYIWFTGSNTPEQITSKLTGQISSNFPINYMSILIEDANGNVVKKAIKNNLSECYEIDIFRETFGLKLNELPAGTYKYTLKAGIARGAATIESFEFTVK